MKIVSLIITSVFIFSCSDSNISKKSDNQSLLDSVAERKEADESIKLDNVGDIQKEFYKVQSNIDKRQLDSAGFKYECNERVGDVSYYYEGKDLKMIRFSTADSHFSSEQYYYINTGKLYFVYIKETLWSFESVTDDKPETKDEIREKRFYIIDGKPIRCLEKKYTIRSSSVNNPHPDYIKNTEMKNCSSAEVENQLEVLMKYRNKRTKQNCL